MLISYLSCPSLMCVQAPGIRAPDVLHQNSAPVQGIEAFAGRVWSLLPTRICFTFIRLLRLSQHVPRILIILRLTIWNDKFPVAPWYDMLRGERAVSIAWICAKFNVSLQSRKRAPISAFHTSRIYDATIASFEIEPQSSYAKMR